MRFVLIVMLLLSFHLGFSQIGQLKLYNISKEDGLISNNAECLFQDSYGYLWMGSFDGLVRWDGYTFRKYVHQEDDKTSLSQNIIYCIFEDSKKRLWIGSIGGLDMYNRETDSFERIVLNPALDRLPINSIYEDRNNNLWLGTSDGLCNYSISSKRVNWFHESLHPDSLSDNAIFSLAGDQQNNLWIGTFNKGVAKLSFTSGKFERFYNVTPTDNKICSNKIKKILIDKNGMIWVGSFDKGVSKLSKNGKLLVHYGSTSKKGGTESHVSCLYQDKKGTIWLGKANELIHYFDTLKNEFTPLKQPAYKKYHLQCKSVASMCEDNFGNIWFGSFCDGLFYSNEYKNKFQHYFNNYVTKDKLSNNVVTCFYEQDRSHVWIGTEDGLNLFDPIRKTIKQFSKRDGLSSSFIQDLKADGNGNLWIATWSGGLMKMNLKTFKIETFIHDDKNENSINYNNLKSIVIQDSIIWIGTHGEGLCIYNLKSKKFTYSENNKQYPFNLKEPAWINHLFLDSKNRLWIGTYGGLYMYDQYSFHRYFHTNDTASISDRDINMITEDKHGNIWIATEAGYLDKFNAKTKTFIHYRNGISKTIKALIFDSNENLWLTGNDGIYCLPKENGKPIHYDVSDGLQGDGFFLKSVMKSSTDFLYMGGTDGFTLFKPDEIGEKQNPIVFNFTDLFVFDKIQKPGAENSVLSKQLAFTDKLILSHKQSFFTIHFTLVDFYSYGNTLFAYKIEGIHNDWISIGNSRSISFTELPPGNYTLKVRYTLRDGSWKEANQTLQLQITPPWWKTIWFKLLSVVIVILSLSLLYNNRIKSIKRRNEKLEAEVQSRTLELMDRNTDLKESNEEIKQQKEQIEEYNEEVVRQSEKILNQQELILEQNRALEKTIEKLSLSDQTKNLFFTILAHDLKGPINAIGSLTDLLANNISNLSKEEIVEFSQHIHKSSSTTRQLVYNLLDWARTQTNYLDFTPIGINVFDLAIDNLALVEQQCFQKNIRILNTLSKEHCVLADKNMMDTIIRNLLNNAIKYTPEGGEISLHSIAKESEIEICIADNGVGMDEEKLANLFLLEKSISKKGTQGEHGTGLGLIIVKEFVDINNGRINVKSTLTQGTTFSINMPKSNEQIVAKSVSNVHSIKEEKSYEIQILKSHDIQKLKGNRILLVEDNAAMRNQLKYLLASTFEISEAENGADALILAEELQPMAIITDMVMPVMDGLEFCRIIKKTPATSHIPVIVLTSHDSEENKLSGYYAGADIYLSKPVRKEILFQVIFNIISSRTHLRDKILNSPESISDLIPLPTVDQDFLETINTFIEENLANQELEVQHLVRHMAISRSVLYAKFKAITGQGVNEYIRLIRLRKSKLLLLSTNLSINEIADNVGFATASYFIRCFVKEYKCTPGELREKR